MGPEGTIPGQSMCYPGLYKIMYTKAFLNNIFIWYYKMQKAYLIKLQPRDYKIINFV